VGEGGDVVAEQRRGVGELGAGQLHAVAGVTRQAYRYRLAFLQWNGAPLRGGQHFNRHLRVPLFLGEGGGRRGRARVGWRETGRLTLVVLLSCFHLRPLALGRIDVWVWGQATHRGRKMLYQVVYDALGGKYTQRRSRFRHDRQMSESPPL